MVKINQGNIHRQKLCKDGVLWSNSVDWLQLRLVREALSDVAAGCNEDLSEVNLTHCVQCNCLTGKRRAVLTAYSPNAVYDR